MFGLCERAVEGKRRSAFHGRIGQMRRVGNTNQVKRLHNVFRLCVLQASLSRHSGEYTPNSTSSEQSDWSRSDFWFIRSRLVFVCVCVCALVAILLLFIPGVLSIFQKLLLL